MKTLTEQLTKYAAYHRDRRNIATHFVGIPMIVVGAAALLGRPALALTVAGETLPLSPATLAMAATIAYYFVLDVRYGVLMTAFMGAALWAGATLAAQPTMTWLAAAGALFVVGWIIQFIGHAFEGRKPAFVDDMTGLLIGPLFVVAEAGFALGLGTKVRAEIESHVGPTLIRKPAAAA